MEPCYFEDSGHRGDTVAALHQRPFLDTSQRTLQKTYGTHRLSLEVEYDQVMVSWSTQYFSSYCIPNLYLFHECQVASIYEVV